MFKHKHKDRLHLKMLYFEKNIKRIISPKENVTMVNNKCWISSIQS